MKYILLVLCTVLAVFALAQADECKFEGHVMKVGETYSPTGECIEYSCVGPNSITGKTCPEFQTGKSCKRIAGDSSKPYPQCCPKPEC
ncbi:venom peptide Pc-like [Calliphora vicina]|uniref:venom peptide Pc-like n=1 Tax=Calliphora vicina TaxID=7373 RepID=UPI00325ADEC3